MSLSLTSFRKRFSSYPVHCFLLQEVGKSFDPSNWATKKKRISYFPLWWLIGILISWFITIPMYLGSIPSPTNPLNNHLVPFFSGRLIFHQPSSSPCKTSQGKMFQWGLSGGRSGCSNTQAISFLSFWLSSCLLSKATKKSVEKHTPWTRENSEEWKSEEPWKGKNNQKEINLPTCFRGYVNCLVE